MGDCLEGKILQFYNSVLEGGPAKYNVLKDRILGKVKRVKRSIKFKKVDDFDKARIKLGKTAKCMQID